MATAWISTLVLTAAVALGCSSVQKELDSASAQQFMGRLDAAWNAFDSGALDRLLAPDFKFLGADGVTYSRESQLKALEHYRRSKTRLTTKVEAVARIDSRTHKVTTRTFVETLEGSPPKEMQGTSRAEYLLETTGGSFVIKQQKGLGPLILEAVPMGGV